MCKFYIGFDYSSSLIILEPILKQPISNLISWNFRQYQYFKQIYFLNYIVVAGSLYFKYYS